ncbi:MAG: hypothetical protein ACRD1F_05010 [Terriglobales bacterium]
MRKWIIGFAALTFVAAAWAAVKPAPFQLVAKSSVSYKSKANFPVTSPELRPDHHDNSFSNPHAGTYHILLMAGPRQNMFSFRVGELTNPIIRVPLGSRLTLNVVNVDDDMVHDLYITSHAPLYGQVVHATAIGSPILRPYKGTRYHAATLVLKAQHLGTAYYVCTVPGHAKKGMWGKIEVTR